MKSKLIGLAVATALSFGSAQAVSLSTNLLANTTANVGLVTTLQSGTLANVTGTATIISTSTDITTATSGLSNVTTLAQFLALTTADPGAVRTNIAITNGAITSTGTTELGAVGNRLYVFMSSTDGTSYGAYKGIVVPSLGTVVINSASLTDLVGTSVYSATGTSGFQLAFAPVPEPSAALLGMLGALGLLRRRR